MKNFNTIIFIIFVAFILNVLINAVIIKQCGNNRSWDGNNCVPDGSVGWNQTCLSRANCASDYECKVVPGRRVHPRSYTCQCKKGTVWDHNKGACIGWQSVMKNKPCLNETSCYDTMICRNDTNVCDCDLDNGYLWTNYSCALNGSQTLYQYCLTDEVCNSTQGLVCSSNYICECPEGYSWNFEKCVEDYSGNYTSVCQIDKNCNRYNYLTCNYVYNLCLCDDSQFYDEAYGYCLDQEEYDYNEY